MATSVIISRQVNCSEMSLHSRCSHVRSAHSTSCKTRLTDHECSPRQEREWLESNVRFVWRLQRAGAKSSGIIPRSSDLENKVLKPFSPFHPVLIRHKSKPAMNKGKSNHVQTRFFLLAEDQKKGRRGKEGEGRDGWQAWLVGTEQSSLSQHRTFQWSQVAHSGAGIVVRR